MSEDGYCCTPDSGDCCGPGSWCCARAGNHNHAEEELVNIPDEAITAAALAIHRYNKSLGLNSTPVVNSSDRAQAIRVLVAAAPHLMAHRAITTVEELDALPRLSVVRPLANMSAAFEKHTMWHEAGSRDLVTASAIPLPVTVLFEPGAGE
jgi:hypothetical protein